MMHLAQTPLQYADVYMDDFIGLSQPTTATQTLRAILHSIHSIFRPESHPDDPPTRKPVLSESKLAAGDGVWSTTKQILGWLIDLSVQTLQLLPHKAERLHELITTILPLRRTSRRKWYKLLGELKHMATAIPGAKHQFSLLQNVLVDQPNAKRVRLNPIVHASIQGWLSLATTLTSNPQPISALVPANPEFIGAVDASGQGLGGFWISNTNTTHNIIFRHQFPPAIAAELITDTNPHGTLTNSDFELAAVIMGAAILSTNTPLHHSHIWSASDNTPAVSWCHRGSTSTQTPNAYLLQWLASLTRDMSFVSCPVSVPGHTNTVAYFCSRSFHLNEQEFLAELHQRFPISGGWTFAHPSPQHVSRMISAMSFRMSPLDSRPPEPDQPQQLGTSGQASARNSTYTQSPSMFPTRSPYYKSSPTDTAPDTYLPPVLQSAVAWWETPFAPLDRRWPTWDSLTRD
jgi:hypothetical protein